MIDMKLTSIDVGSTVSQLLSAVWDTCRLTIELEDSDGNSYAGQTKLANVPGLCDRSPLSVPTITPSMKVSEVEAAFAAEWGAQVQVLNPKTGKLAHNDAQIDRYGFRVWLTEPQLSRLGDKSTCRELFDAFEADYGFRIHVRDIGASAHIGKFLATTPPLELSLNAQMTVASAEMHIRDVWGIDVRVVHDDENRAVSKSQVLAKLGFKSPPALQRFEGVQPAVAMDVAVEAKPAMHATEVAQPVNGDQRVKRAARLPGMGARLENCPYPLAMSLYRAELDGGIDWNSSMAALHCAMRILALPIVALAATHEEFKGEAAKTLVAPAWGTWNSLLLQFAKRLSVSHPWAALIQADLNRELKDPAALQLAKCFGEVLGSPFGSQSVAVHKLFSDHVAFRNATEGHGTIPRRSVNERYARAMFEGACCIVDRCDSIRSMRIVEVKSKEETHSGSVVDAREWVGLRPVKVDGLSPVGRSPLYKGAILMAPETGEWISLDGWIFHWEKIGDELLLFNGVEKRSPTYLTLHNGLTLHESNVTKGKVQADGNAAEGSLEPRPAIDGVLRSGLDRLMNRLTPPT